MPGRLLFVRAAPGEARGEPAALRALGCLLPGLLRRLLRCARGTLPAGHALHDDRRSITVGRHLRRRTLGDLNTLYVRTNTGALVPLASVVTTQVRGDTPDRERMDRQRSMELTSQLAPGYTVAEAVAFLQEEAAKKKQEEDAKKDKALADAAARLKAAQSAYQAEIAKKGGQQ